jgi:N-acyl-D-aspartate/D-glutamate deacylase
VVAIGTVDEPATQIIQADGLMVAPGFVDLHTHYDAQLFWDPTASPSPLHGVTTVLGGNCGFSLAPSGPDHAGYLARMMAKVEGMPLAALEVGLDWSWTSFGQWLDRLEDGIGVNAGFLVGHSALRRTVMGDDAVTERATDDQVAAMVASLHDALGSGALGFSTSQVATHHDGEGRPVPSRAASRSEIESMAAVVADYPGTTIEMIVQGCLTGFSEEETGMMAAVSRLANRPVNWNVLGTSATTTERTATQLAASDTAAEHGGTVVALTLPHNMRIRLSFEGNPILEGLPGWSAMLSLPKAERLTALQDPEVRRRLNEGAHSEDAGALRNLVVWHRLTLDETFAPENAGYEGRTVGDVAAERNQQPFDALLDIVVADELRTGLRPPMADSDADWEARARLWRDHRTVVGGSDAGAHLDMMCGAIYSTALLGGAVRQRNLLSWEEAVHLLTDVPARLYGLKQRGRVAEGWWADLVVFDPATIGHGPDRRRDDMPGGASRLYAEGTGVEHVVVNGSEMVRHGAFTGTLSGQLLRSGRHTSTVPAGAAWRPDTSTMRATAGGDRRNAP